MCDGDFTASECPGLCRGLRDCMSCAMQGRGATVTESRLQNLWQNEACAWCVQDVTCQKRNGELKVDWH